MTESTLIALLDAYLIAFNNDDDQMASALYQLIQTHCED